MTKSLTYKNYKKLMVSHQPYNSILCLWIYNFYMLFQSSFLEILYYQFIVTKLANVLVSYLVGFLLLKKIGVKKYGHYVASLVSVWTKSHVQTKSEYRNPTRSEASALNKFEYQMTKWSKLTYWNCDICVIGTFSFWSLFWTKTP